MPDCAVHINAIACSGQANHVVIGHLRNNLDSFHFVSRSEIIARYLIKNNIYVRGGGNSHLYHLLYI